jgi:hypothetical protein
MPLFDFKCLAGHVLRDVRVKADRSDAPSLCPTVLAEDATPEDHAGETTICGESLQQCLAAPASIFPGAASWRGK